MRTLILAVLVSFAAVSLNAAPANLSTNMKMTAATASKRAAQDTNDNMQIKFVGYSEFTTGQIAVTPKLTFKGKTASVYFFELDEALAYAFKKNKAYSDIEVTLSADDKDLSNHDPHHKLPVYANIVVKKGKEVIEQAKFPVFEVELWEVWQANRPVEKKVANDYFIGDPHNQPEKVKNNKKESAEPVYDRYH